MASTTDTSASISNGNRTRSDPRRDAAFALRASAPKAGNRRDQVDHMRLAERRLVVPRLFGDGDAGSRELILDVLARLFEGRRAGRPRADPDKLPQILPGAVRIELRCSGGLQHERPSNQITK